MARPPSVARPAMRARGSRPSRPSAGSSVSSMAAAPSLSGEALPAVTDPSGRKLGRRRNSASSEVSARMLSSRLEEPAAGFVGDEADLLVEPAGVPRRGGAAVRPQGERILRLAADALALRQDLSALAQRHRPLRGHARVDQPPAERRGVQRLVAAGIRGVGLGQDPRRPAHGLDAARDRDGGVAHRDGPVGGDHCLEPGAAQPVDGRPRNRHRQPGQEHGHAAPRRGCLRRRRWRRRTTRRRCRRGRGRAPDRRERAACGRRGRRGVFLPAHRRSGPRACARRRRRNSSDSPRRDSTGPSFGSTCDRSCPSPLDWIRSMSVARRRRRAAAALATTPRRAGAGWWCRCPPRRARRRSRGRQRACPGRRGWWARRSARPGCGAPWPPPPGLRRGPRRRRPSASGAASAL